MRLPRGSGWKEYQEPQSVCGVKLPAVCSARPNCRSRFSRPPPRPEAANTTRTSISPRWKNHRARTPPKCETPNSPVHRSRRLRPSRGASSSQIPKFFEFGVDDAGALHLIDEVLTPDSSRFWPVDTYKVGASPESFDKQYIRNWLRFDRLQTASRPHRVCHRKLRRRPATNIERHSLD